MPPCCAGAVDVVGEVPVECQDLLHLSHRGGQ